MRIPEWLPDTYRPTRPANASRRPLIERLVQPLPRFLHVEAASGLVLLVCTVLALVLANSAWSVPFSDSWQTRVGFTVGGFALYKPLLLWVNDGLMTIFFFLVGLEIKREFVFGELQDPRKVALPAAAALGGMVVPAAVYLLWQCGEPGERGWGIPMATDIAFVVGFGVIYLFRRLGVRPVPVYVVLGAGIWLTFLKSGVHPTVAGVLLGLFTPAYPWFVERSLLNVADGVSQRLRRDRETGGEAMAHHEEAVHLLTTSTRETISPLDRLETALHPWVAFGIMPLFALANAGVAVELSAMSNPVAVAVTAGLVLGKPLGIVALSWAAVKLGLARLPSGVNWGGLVGAGCLAGIGFTMSLFIAGLALEADLRTAGKIGILLGSILSAILGLGLLLCFLPRPSGYREAGAETAGMPAEPSHDYGSPQRPLETRGEK